MIWFGRSRIWSGWYWPEHGHRVDELEGGSGGGQRLGGAVDVGAQTGDGLQILHVGPGLGATVRGQQVGVIAGPGDHGQDASGLRIGDHGGGLNTGGKGIVGRLLHLRVDGQFDLGTLHGRAGEQFHDAVDELSVRRAGQVTVHLLLQAGGPEGQ